MLGLLPTGLWGLIQKRVKAVLCIIACQLAVLIVFAAIHFLVFIVFISLLLCQQQLIVVVVTAALVALASFEIRKETLRCTFGGYF